MIDKLVMKLKDLFYISTNNSMNIIGVALTYIGMLFWFTHTDWIISLFNVSVDSFLLFIDKEANPISSITNWGLLLLLVIDYRIANKSFADKVVLTHSLGFLLILLIFGQAYVAKNLGLSLDYPMIANRCVSVILQTCFWGILFYMKKLGLQQEVVEDEGFVEV